MTGVRPPPKTSERVWPGRQQVVTGVWAPEMSALVPPRRRPDEESPERGSGSPRLPPRPVSPTGEGNTDPGRRPRPSRPKERGQNRVRTPQHVRPRGGAPGRRRSPSPLRAERGLDERSGPPERGRRGSGPCHYHRPHIFCWFVHINLDLEPGERKSEKSCRSQIIF